MYHLTMFRLIVFCRLPFGLVYMSFFFHSLTKHHPSGINEPPHNKTHTILHVYDFRKMCVDFVQRVTTSRFLELFQLLFVFFLWFCDFVFFFYVNLLKIFELFILAMARTSRTQLLRNWFCHESIFRNKTAYDRHTHTHKFMICNMKLELVAS